MIKILVKCGCGSKYHVEPEKMGGYQKCSSCGKDFYLVEYVEGLGSNQSASSAAQPRQQTRGDDVFAPEVVRPTYADTPIRPTRAYKPPREVAGYRGGVPGYGAAPSYYAVQALVVCLTCLAFSVLIGGLITASSMSKSVKAGIDKGISDLDKEIKEADIELGAALMVVKDDRSGKPNAEAHSYINILGSQIAALKAQRKELLAEKSNPIITGIIFGTIFSFILILASAQVLSCIRDTARNSFRG